MRDRARVGVGKVEKGDPRFGDLVRRGFNKRFTAEPDCVHLVGSVEDVEDAVRGVVRDGQRMAVRSGGHCLEGFVADPAVRVVIDTSLMSDVYYDPQMRAFAVEAGATLGEVYRRLFLGWGVTIPAGESPDLGMGGHVSGGAFGFWCRRLGLAADHLYGVEVVVVDEAGAVRTVVATREPNDPNRELWWAHTGGGGGNFGIATRYWFRSPGAGGDDPASLLPRAPDSVLAFRAGWSWDGVDEAAFRTLVRNFGVWCQRNGDPRSVSADLFSILFLRRSQYGKLEIKGVSIGAQAERLVDEHVAAVNHGVGIPCVPEIERTSWLAFAVNPFPELFRVGMGNARMKGKDAYFRRPLTDRQVEVAHRYLTRVDYDVPGGMLGLATYGGAVNSVASDATATAQRDSILSTSCTVGWGDPGDEARCLAWVRAFYGEMFAETGGVPAPGELCDGAMINHPDVDLADPAWNTSGIPWSTLYYKDNYPRLQGVKSRWDPRNVFRHALSVQPT